MRLPETFHPESVEEAEKAAAAIPYPAVMKPSLGSGFKARYGKPLIEAADAAALVAAYRLGEPFQPMFQELIPGGDDCAVDGGQLPGRRGAGVGRVLRQEAAAVAGRGRNLPCGRGDMGPGRG